MIYKIPDKQERVWILHLKGLNQRDIAKKLNLSRQAVSLYLREAKAKINKYLISLSEIMDLDIVKLNTEKGILVGINRQTKMVTYIIYIPYMGFRAIYTLCNKKSECYQLSDCIKVVNYISKLIKEQQLKGEVIDDYEINMEIINLIKKYINEL